MNAKDLMIGDWVSSRGKIEQVREVYDGYICTDSFEDSHDYHFEPIPITPEILEKNGFEQDFYKEEVIADCHRIRLDVYSLKGKNYLIMFCNGNVRITTDFNGIVRKDMKYVHELQHALKLCEIDKEINL